MVNLFLTEDKIKELIDNGAIFKILVEDDQILAFTEYIKETDSNYLSKDIASYYHHSRMIKLYLQTNVTFINDDSKQIDLSDSDYVILNEKVRFHNFHRIYHCGDFYLYSHN